MLKRKLDEGIDDAGEGDNAAATITTNGHSENDDSNCSSGSTDALAPEAASGPSPPKRMKKKVNFKGVSVYYFPRKQGFTCVPSEGGSTLGMAERHSFTRDFSLSDYTKEQKRIHRAVLAEQRRQGKMFPSPLLASSLPPLENDEDVSSGSESDSEYDDYYFLQPLPIRQRRVLLRTAGVKKIDNDEKDECRDIRVSRNVCGCDCKLVCHPATCACSLAGIRCQVDRLSFPCGCTKDGCSNPAGRIEFNPIRVRTHFIHTLMRLELERKDSQSIDGSPAATIANLSPKSSTCEIDVVGTNGLEHAACSGSAEGSEPCSSPGSSTNSGTSSSGKVLKSRLKAKKAEIIDLNMFNSNEKGSCRDCQNTDMCNVMMHDVKFSMVTQQHRQQQQQRAIATALGPQAAYSGPQLQQQQHHHHLAISAGMSLIHPPPQQQQQQQQQPSSQHMLLFNDGDEEVYRSENTSSIYFDSDDSSYSDLNDVSPDILESRSFSNVNQGAFSGKYHVSAPQMFACNNGVAGNSSIGSLQPPGMSKQPSLSNPSCIQNLQMSSTCLSTSTCRVEQQQACGLATSHPQHQPAAVSNQPLSRASFLPRASRFSAGQFVGPSCTIAPASTLHTQTSLMNCSQMDTSLELEPSESTVMIQGPSQDFQNKFVDTGLIETHPHSLPMTYKLDSPMGTSSKTYSSSVTEDYLKQPNHNSYSTPQTVGFASTAVTSVITEGSSSFQAHQTMQHTSCWSASLTSPTVRECFGLAASTSESPPSITDQRASQLEISCSSSYQQAPELGSAGTAAAPAVSPESPNSSTITYATMTTTTRDRLAAHCPGISSHMDCRPDLTTSEDRTPFPNYHVSSESSDTRNLVGTSQNLLYNLPYTNTRTIKSCSNGSITCHTSSDNSGKIVEPLAGREHMILEPVSNTFSQPIFQQQHPPKLTPEVTDSSLTYSTDVSSSLTFIPPLSSDSLSTTSSTAACSTKAVTFDQAPASIEATVPLGHPSASPHVETQFNSLRSKISNIGLASKDMNSTVEQLNEACLFENGHSTPDYSNTEDHLGIWKPSYDMKEHEDESRVWVVDKEHSNNETPGTSDDQEVQFEGITTNPEISSASSSEARSAASSSSSSISSSPTMSEEEKDQRTSQDFGEIIKESIIEMVLV